MFSPGMPSGFSMYESGDGGRSSERGREGDEARWNRGVEGWSDGVMEVSGGGGVWSGFRRGAPFLLAVLMDRGRGQGGGMGIGTQRGDALATTCKASGIT